MENINFKVGAEYSKKDIYKIMNVPTKQQGGNWNTGYNKFNNEWFLFCNVGTKGRSEHDYPNHFFGENLIWHGKQDKGGLHTPSIQHMLSKETNVYIFYRENNKSSFTFAGLGEPLSYEDKTPVKVTWGFKYFDEVPDYISSEEIIEPSKYPEGAKKTIVVNAYERSPAARKKCIEFYGAKCVVCLFDFSNVYGELGQGFIHVHHVNPIANKGKEYDLDPIADLKPVCPNCHAMLHKKNPPLTIDQLKKILKA